MASSANDPGPRRYPWSGSFVAFVGGVLAGATLYAGWSTGWDNNRFFLMAGGVILLVLGGLLADPPQLRRDKTHPLPGEIYGKGRKTDGPIPGPKGVGASTRNGNGSGPAAPRPRPDAARWDSAGTATAGATKTRPEPRTQISRDARLRQELQEINRAFQRAKVQLGLGELSEDGYTHIVTDLKARRAKLEHELNRSGPARA